MSTSEKSDDFPHKRPKQHTMPATPPQEADEPPVEDMSKEDKIQQTGDLLRQNLNNPERRQEYDQQRGELLKEEQTNSWDRESKNSATHFQTRAADIVWKIREHERDNLFGNRASEQIPEPSTRDMGGQFLTNKERIEEKSHLFKIVKKMPKGAHLHAHFNAELPVDNLLERVRNMDTMFVRSTQPLILPEDYENSEIVFTVLRSDHAEADLFSKSYNPAFKNTENNPWMKWINLQSRFRDQAPSSALNAEEWVKKKMVLSEEEVYGTSQTVNG